MAEIATIARPYAEAAFRLARERGRLAEWSETVGGMAQVADMAGALIGHPNVPAREIESLFDSACGAMDVEAGNLLRLLIENGRLPCLPEIARQFEELRRQDSGIREASIESAFPLDEAQVSFLKTLLEERFRTPLKVSVTVAPGLIGGIKAVVGDQVLDTSVRGKLDTMAVALNS